MPYPYQNALLGQKTNNALAEPRSFGLLAPGTIKNLYSRAVLNNRDGTWSTTKSMSFNEDGVEVLVPTVINGKQISNKEAIEHYKRTGEHLGKFGTWQAADAFAKKLHEDQARLNLVRPPAFLGSG